MDILRLLHPGGRSSIPFTVASCLLILTSCQSKPSTSLIRPSSVPTVPSNSAPVSPFRPVSDADLEALSQAAWSGDIPAMRTLLHKGIDIETDTDTNHHSGRTPLMVAAMGGRFGMIRFLVAQGAHVRQARSGRSVFTEALGDSHYRLADELLRRQIGVDPRSKADLDAALATVIDDYKPKAINYLLDRGADPGAKGFDGTNALMALAQYEHSTPTDLRLARRLLRQGIDVNARDSDGRTALMNASYTTNAVMVRLLLSHGAQVGLQDRDGDTALTALKKAARQFTNVNSAPVIALLERAARTSYPH